MGVRSSQGVMDLLSSEHRSSAQLFPPDVFSLFMLQQDYLGSSFSLAFPAESSGVAFKINNITTPSYSCKVGRGHRRKNGGVRDQSEKKT